MKKSWPRSMEVRQDQCVMLIQEEAPRLADPLATFDEDYAEAVIHLAWDLNTKTKERTLLFAMVELLPVEVPPPIDDGEQRERLGGGSEHYVYVRHVVVPARRALEWHLDCRRGLAIRPEEDGTLLDAADPRSVKLRLADLGEEPPWPTLVCVSGESDTAPFCPAWHEHPRVHHLVPLASMALDKLWPKASERERAMTWLSERLHFDLEEYSEYWGSVHLVAPNPVYRAITVRRNADVPPPRDVILLRLSPRMRKSVDGLEVTFTSKEPWGPLDIRHFRVKSPLVRLRFDKGVSLMRRLVFDGARGVLEAAYHDRIFIRSVSLGARLTTRRLRIDGNKSGTQFEVSRTSAPALQSVVGTLESAASGANRLHEAHQKRRKRAEARARDERWFSGEQEEAAAALRSRIFEAQEEVLIVDPYFGADEVMSFALAISREDVPIRILTSAETLKDNEAEKGAALVARLDALASAQQVNSFDVRVMVGKRPDVHDRFLLIDKRIWLLGSSLNEFGSRGTMMVELSDPDSVREPILNAWSQAVELRSWVEAKKRNSALTEGT